MTDYNKRTLITPTRDDVADFVPPAILVVPVLPILDLAYAPSVCVATAVIE